MTKFVKTVFTMNTYVTKCDVDSDDDCNLIARDNLNQFS